MIKLLITVLLLAFFVILFSDYIYAVSTIAAGVVIGNFVYHKLLS